MKHSIAVEGLECIDEGERQALPLTDRIDTWQRTG